MKVVSTIISASLLIGSVAGILGGETVPKGKNTFTTGIRSTIDPKSFDRNISCVGTLISSTHVLTSVACTEEENANIAAVGAHYVNGDETDGEEIKVAKVTTHPHFEVDTLRNDFAVLTLEKATKFNPVKLPTRHHSGIRTSMNATVMGWGITSLSSEDKGSYELLQLSQQLITNKACRKALNVTTVNRTQVCAGGEKGKSPCYGDFGGPLINYDGVLIGLYSGGNDCGIANSPAIYARVPSALVWIHSVINT